jgi:hypothetical protein
MKKFTILKSLILAVGLLLAVSGWGQGNETFANLPTTSASSYLERIWTGDDGVTWTAQGARTDQTITGKAICWGNSGTRNVITPTYSGGMGTLSFKYVRAFTGANARSLEVYVNDVKIGETIIVSPTSDVVIDYEEEINVAGNIVLEIRSTGAAQVRLDDIVWTAYASEFPFLTAIPLVLSDFTYEAGSGPSASQSFSVSGLNLDPADGNITVTGSTNFEVSDDDNTFSSSVLLPYTVGELAATNVYVRLKSGLAEGSYNSETIAVTGGGATQVDVTVSGEVTAPPTPPAELNLSGYQESFSDFIGTGFLPNPSVGQLHSGNWKVTGMSDGDGTFDGTHISGDFARGNSSGGVTTGGVYAFSVGSGVTILGVQTGSSDFAPGAFTLRLENSTGNTIEYLDVSYDIYYYNDQDRSSSFNFAFSIDDIDYTQVNAIDFTTPEVADVSPTWVKVERSTLLSGLSLENGEFIFLRWNSDDVGGSGSRDEFGLTNIEVLPAEAPVIPAPVFSVSPDNYFEDQFVFISNLDDYSETVEIRYTTNGDDPDGTSSLYDDIVGIYLEDGNGPITLKAIAIEGSNESQISTAVYTFPLNVANIQALRAQPTGTTIYRVDNEATFIGGTSFRNTKYFQDDSGFGIQIDDPPPTITTTYEIGDNVAELIGTLGIFQGQLQFTPSADPGSPVSIGNIITPLVRTLDALNFDDQSRLVKVYDVEFEDGDGINLFGGGGFSTNITDPSLVGFTGWFRNVIGESDITGSVIPDASVNITGIIQQNNNGFNLAARSLSDFELSQVLLIGAVDDASNYSQSDYISEGNLGYGFGSWFSQNNEGGYLRNSAGEQGMNSGQIDTDGNSFGVFADGFSDVGRLFGSPLPDGHSFSFTLAYQFDNGNKGFSLYDNDWVTELFNWNVNSSGYAWNGGSAVTTPWENDRQNGVAFEFTFTQNGSDLDFEFSSIAGGGPSGSGTLTNTNADRIKFYVSGAGGGTGGNLYFNSLAIELTDPTAIPQYVDLYVKGQVELNANLEVENLIIETGQFLQINPGVNLTVNGTLNNDNAGSKSEAGLLIKSDATGTGSLINNTSGVDATVERYIAAANWADSTLGWHLLSSPVSGQAIDGIWTPSGVDGDYDFYAWDESNVEFPWLNQKEAGNGITQFNAAQGYLVAYEQTGIREFVGPLNAGEISFTLLNSEVTKNWTWEGGWNLIGNPYPSGIDWSLVDHDEVTSLFQDVYAYIYNTNKSGGAGYEAVNGTLTDAFIAAHQGFFVLAKASSDNIDFTFTNDMRVHEGTFLKSDLENYIHLRLAQGGFYDETTIWLKQESKLNRDPYDALKMFSFHPAVPQVYSMTQDDVWVAINSIPEISESMQIPVSIRIPANGSMSLSISGLDGEFANQNIILLDLLTGESHDFSQHNEYHFTGNTSDSPDRFQLKFEAVGIAEVPGSESLQAWVNGNILYVMNSGNSKALVEVYNIQGQVIMSHEVGKGLQSLPAKVAPGTYIVRMISEEETATRKVVIQ